jgi:hypothetical protein
MLDKPLAGKYTIDRFEGHLAVLLYRPNERIELLLPKTLLPKEAEEGSVLSIKTEDGKIESITYLVNETEMVRNQNQLLLQSLILKNPSN